jgi:quinol monooxygenase YgiN
VPEPGYRQLLLLCWRARIPPGRRAATLDAAAALGGAVEGLAAVEISESCHHDDQWDAVVVMDFTDEAAWKRYLSHPAHRAFVETHSAPTIEDRAVIHCRLDRWQRYR